MRLLVAEQDQALGTFLARSFDEENYSVDVGTFVRGARRCRFSYFPIALGLRIARKL